MYFSSALWLDFVYFFKFVYKRKDTVVSCLAVKTPDVNRKLALIGIAFYTPTSPILVANLEGSPTAFFF